jgi:hypothetical protein
MPFLPSADEEILLAHVYAYCDESGKEHEHKIVVFNCLADIQRGWDRLKDTWMRLLQHYHLSEFSAKQALRHSQQYGTMGPGTAEQRASDVMPFVRAIVDNLELGVIGAIDVQVYKSQQFQSLRSSIHEDPHFFAFYVALSKLLQHWTVPSDYTVGLILDDDEQKAMQCYKFLKRMKAADPEVRRRVPYICFGDDKSAFEVQAADVFTYLCRIDAEKKFVGKEHPYRTLCDAFEIPITGTERLQIEGGFYGQQHLAEYMESRKQA